MQSRFGLSGWIFLALLLATLYVLAPVFTPFLISALLAYLCNPLVERLQRMRCSRTFSVVLVFFLICFMLLIAGVILIPLVVDQIVTLANRVPEYVNILQTKSVPYLENKLNIHLFETDTAVLRQALGKSLDSLGTVIKTIASSLGRSSMAVINWIANLMLIPVITFYLLRDWTPLIQSIRNLIPRSVEKLITHLVCQSDEMLGSFIRGQLLVMLSLGFIYSVGLSIAGVEFALLIGVISGLVSFVPYLGFTLGILIAGTAALLQFQALGALMPVVIVYSIGQVMESFFLTPVFVGDKIGMHPVAVIFALLTGGQLFGFFGVLLALPAAAVIMVVLRYGYGEYLKSDFYKNPNWLKNKNVPL